MQKRLNELLLERGRLIERIAHQRDTLSQQLTPLGHSMDVGLRVREWVDRSKAFVQAHPLAIGAGVVLLIALKPNTMLRWTVRGVSIWRTLRTVRNMLPPSVLNRFF